MARACIVYIRTYLDLKLKHHYRQVLVTCPVGRKSGFSDRRYDPLWTCGIVREVRNGR